VIDQKEQAKKESRTAAGFNILKYSLRVRVALIALFLLSFGVIGWQALAHQGLTSTALYGLVPTPNETSKFQLSDLFPGLVATSVKAASRRTATPTPTPTMAFTTSRTPTHTVRPTSTTYSGGIFPINTLVPTIPPFATNTRVPPTAIPPTPVPPTLVPPTFSVPTSTATSPLPTVVIDTPSGPTATPLPPPSDTPVPPPTSTTGPTVAPTEGPTVAPTP
jgi:hypothetical protein